MEPIIKVSKAWRLFGPQRQAELVACTEALARLRAERAGHGDPVAFRNVRIKELP